MSKSALKVPKRRTRIWRAYSRCQRTKTCMRTRMPKDSGCQRTQRIRCQRTQRIQQRIWRGDSRCHMLRTALSCALTLSGSLRLCHTVSVTRSLPRRLWLSRSQDLTVSVTLGRVEAHPVSQGQSGSVSVTQCQSASKSGPSGRPHRRHPGEKDTKTYT